MKIASIFAAFLVLAGFASAQVGSIDTECQAHGFMGGIVKYEWADSGGYVAEDPAIDPWVISVVGDTVEANWTASPDVAGVLVNGGTEYDEYAGGSSGTVACVWYANPGGQESCHGISHITFCYDQEVTTTTVPTDLPEFPSLVLPALLALLVPSAAYLVYKAR